PPASRSGRAPHRALPRVPGNAPEGPTSRSRGRGRAGRSGTRPRRGAGCRTGPSPRRRPRSPTAPPRPAAAIRLPGTSASRASSREATSAVRGGSHAYARDRGPAPTGRTPERPRRRTSATASEGTHGPRPSLQRKVGEATTEEIERGLFGPALHLIAVSGGVEQTREDLFSVFQRDPDGSRRLTAVRLGPRGAGHGDRDVGPEDPARPRSHLPGARLADDAGAVDRLARHAEDGDLRVRRVTHGRSD